MIRFEYNSQFASILRRTYSDLDDALKMSRDSRAQSSAHARIHAGRRQNKTNTKR